MLFSTALCCILAYPSFWDGFPEASVCHVYPPSNNCGWIYLLVVAVSFFEFKENKLCLIVSGFCAVKPLDSYPRIGDIVTTYK